jgi:hypothetical protein
MICPISQELVALLKLKDPRSIEGTVNLNELRDELISRTDLGQIAPRMRSLDFGGRHVLRGKLLVDLQKIRKADSHVRDMLTIGHLCKYLYRLDVLTTDAGFRVCGLPNAAFDAISIKERDEYFSSGRTLHILGSPEEKQLAELVRRREIEEQRGQEGQGTD